MSPAERPVIIIVTGAWHVPSHYSKLSNRLRHLGFTVECPLLLTNNNAQPANKTLDDDVNLIRELTLSYLKKGHNVVGVVHSYGGIVGSTAFAGLGASARGTGQAHVQALLYMCAFVPLQGESLFQIIGGGPAPWFHANEGLGVLEIDVAKETLYNDLSKEECQRAVEALVVHATRAQAEAPSEQLQKDGVAWQQIPTSYLICGKDQAGPPGYQEMMLDRAEAMFPDCKMRRECCSAGHSPFLSQPDRVAEVVNSVASA